MLFKNDPGRPDPEALDALAHQFGRFEPGVVELLEEQNLKIITPETPKEMAASMARGGALKTTDTAKIEARAQEAGDFDPTTLERATKMGSDLASLQKERDGASPEDAAKLDREISNLKKRRRRVIDSALKREGLPFSVAGSTDARTIREKEIHPKPGPVSVEELALRHGFKGAEQQNRFSSLVEKANGDRLSQARQASIQKEKEKLEAVTSLRERARLEGRLEQWEADPNTIPVDPDAHDILVPDVVRYRTGPEDTMEMTQGSWSKFVSNNGAAGIYFNQKKLLQVDHEQSTDFTFTHEVGHAIDDAVKTTDPEFYRQWKKGVMKAYEGAEHQGHGEIISEYSRTNTTEYIAESVRLYMRNPERMQKIDPEMYELTEELLHYAADLGENPEIR